MNPQARVLLFTGDGKGKTTAALGMALRAAGHGLRTLILQFVKHDAKTGEIAALRQLPLVEIEQHGLGFLPPADSQAFSRHQEAAREGLHRAAQSLKSGRYALVILDEVCFAVARGVLTEQEVVQVVKAAPAGVVVVLTGRGASDGLAALADTVTEMRCIKHGLHSGWGAQEGVEL